MNFCSAVIFDLDGVLVDVRNSYPLAALETVAYLHRQAGSGAEAPGFTAQDFRIVKRWGGFNNDWDLTLALWWIHTAGLNIDDGGEPPGLRAAVLGDTPFRQQWSGTVTDVFQQLYLGPAAFNAVYRRSATAVKPNHRGLIENERPWIPADFLQRWSRHHYRVLLTGRPRPETLMTLHKLGGRDSFQLVLTDTEGVARAGELGCPTATFRKPSAQLARWLQSLLPVGVRRLTYLGDTRDDWQLCRGFQLPCRFIRCAFEDPARWPPALDCEIVFNMYDLRRIF